MVRRPSRFAVRAMRQAISPRLAMRTERNIVRASHRLMQRLSTHCVCAAPALACGGGNGPSCTGPPAPGATPDAVGLAVVAAGGGSVPGVQTGSTFAGGGGEALIGTGAGTAGLRGRRDDAGPSCASASPAVAAATAAAPGGPLGSGFIILIAGIDSEVGKSISTTLCGGAAGGLAEDASASGTSGGCAHTVR